ncbi:hypothetical protein INN71_04420 [Nocardioides sp. ChNu-153]|uniref:hypothetical protein n=1 Tax=unclassified Nocardioides TaxID=2615069 RepID=UPI00240770D3|nr:MULTISPECIES: hypothetical protein [unclassified Nocardioides]MDF9715469.1 hypothetical protein [Nocardioides sp. ChNu-99]MDN7120632.1 hypothetical protein [Nocardioides sp. ChNu-153]
MTTASRSSAQDTPWATRAVLRTAGPVAGLAVLLAVVGGLVQGADAALGALVGGALLLVVLTTSTAIVAVLSSWVSGSLMLLAMLTYTLNVLLVLVALAALAASGATDGPLSARWLGGAVVLGAVAWSVVQVVVTTRLRVPLYDLPERSAVPTPAPTSVPTSVPAERPGA